MVRKSQTVDVPDNCMMKDIVKITDLHVYNILR